MAVGQDDPLAEPLMAELAVEYANRYGAPVDGVAWLRTYPADEFAAPGGGLLDRAARRPTGHRRRIPPIRRRHRRTQTDLDRQPAPPPRPRERTADPAGNRDRRPWLPPIYLTTGDRQPEAEALYLSTGYNRLAEPLPAEGEVYPIAFPKVLAMTGHLHLAVALEGYGWHPQAWRQPQTPRPSPVAGTGRSWRPPLNVGCWTS